MPLQQLAIVTDNLGRLIRDASNTEGGAQAVRAAARLMSTLEREPQRLPELFREIPVQEWPQPRLILGVTGAPGSGKSSLTDALITEFRRRYPERRIGVIAVDPSSPFTGGAVLGDRVRMMRHATDPMVFIRSLASRGHLGGLALGVKGVIHAMGLIGCDTVIVETVGVGQSEVEVARVADLVAVVLAPGQGDAVQLLKAGLIEVGDLFVVNKADREGADTLYKNLLNALSLAQEAATAAPYRPEDDLFTLRRPEAHDVMLVSATESRGLPELMDTLERRISEDAARWTAAREARLLEEMQDAILEESRRRVQGLIRREDLERVLRGEVSVAEVTEGVFRELAEREKDQPAPADPI